MNDAEHGNTCRSRWQFSLRIFLVVCLSVGLTTGVCAAYVKSVMEVVRQVQSLESRGMVVHSDFLDRYGLYPFDRNGTWQAVFEWSLSNPETVETNRRQPVRIPEVLELIALLPTLRTLDLSLSDVTSEDLRQLTPLHRLEHLDLKCTRVDDVGLAALGELPQLRILDVSKTRVSDAGLASMAQINCLERVYAYGSYITEQGRGALRRTRPDIAIGGTLGIPAEMPTLHLGFRG